MLMGLSPTAISMLKNSENNLAQPVFLDCMLD